MNTNIRRKDLLFPELSYQIVGACFFVHNQIGNGHKEDLYQRALAKRFEEIGLTFDQQVRCPVYFDSEIVGAYVYDFVVANRIVVELKVGGGFRKRDYAQLGQYLKQGSYPLGLLVRFSSHGVISHRILPPSQDS